MATTLSPAERELVIDQLRDEALDECRALGCTCSPEPVMTLTKGTAGPYNLPAWLTEHPDECPMSLMGLDA